MTELNLEFVLVSERVKKLEQKDDDHVNEDNFKIASIEVSLKVYRCKSSKKLFVRSIDFEHAWWSHSLLWYMYSFMFWLLVLGKVYPM